MSPSQHRIASELVENIHNAFQGFHAGYRDVHSSGRYYAGTFTATPEAKKLSRAMHLQGGPVPVTVRHSNSRSGNPWGPATSVSMAVRFYLSDGRTTDLVGLGIPRFLARTPEETLALLKVLAPDPATGKLDMEVIGAFLKSHPEVAGAVHAAKEAPAAVSFARTNFHMLHAFRFVAEDDTVTHARYHWEAEAGVASQTIEELQANPPNYLFEELEARLRNGPVLFNLVLQLAGDGDPLDDPNATWPDDRPRVNIGQLSVRRTTTVEEIGDSVMMHDPTRLIDGIEPTDDPILAVRRGVYELSVAYRTGGWKGRMASFERAGVCPFGGDAFGKPPDK